MSDIDVRQQVRALLDAQTASGRHARRQVKDRMAKYGIAVGGIAVIFAVLLIFGYLFSVVLPIFESAEMEAVEQVPVSVEADSRFTRTDEYGELLFQLTPAGHIEVTKVDNGARIKSQVLSLAEGVTLVSVATINRHSKLYALGFSDHSVLLVTLSTTVSYDAEQNRTVHPVIAFPFGEQFIQLWESEEPMLALAGAGDEEEFKLVAQTSARNVQVFRFAAETSFLDDSMTLEHEPAEALNSTVDIRFLLIEPDGNYLFAASEDGAVESWDLRKSPAEKLAITRLTAPNVQLTELEFLMGGISLLAGDSSGTITQWFRHRNEFNTNELRKVRSFELSKNPVKMIVPEPRRKGFVAIDEQGHFGIFYTTSHRKVLDQDLPVLPASMTLNSSSKLLITVDPDGRLRRYDIDNEHPDISWSALWTKVWYESYEEPAYTWQSSSGSDEFEPKFNVMPLAFGTLKAAFYAMMFALPIGICGAIFTAYFMAPEMRQMVKPVVEVMASLPSVILGFVAGLWLAPVVEDNLAGTFAILLLMPLVMVGFGLLWHHAPKGIRHLVKDGWQAALLLPVIILAGFLLWQFGYLFEDFALNGDARFYLTNNIGIDFEQRNALIVGIAMGFAVIPIVFSISEDAIFGVPKSLINGSLALGASPWQTMVRVVLPTASPGIFSAVMIGLGRAVGETMIVLMATGNTPIMEANLFEGLRTLSANIAVEMPEAEVGSSHYRILFLSALVLFLFTLIFNTVAETVRQRLRKQYGSL